MWSKNDIKKNTQQNPHYPLKIATATIDERTLILQNYDLKGLALVKE